MSESFRVALAVVILGGLMGLVVLGATAAAGRANKLVYWLAGTAWGLLTIGMLLTDCMFRRNGPGPVSDASIPLFFAGLVIWPVVLSWKHPRWALRWLAAQAVMLAAVAPAFVASIGAALCSFT